MRFSKFIFEIFYNLFRIYSKVFKINTFSLINLETFDKNNENHLRKLQNFSSKFENLRIRNNIFSKIIKNLFENHVKWRLMNENLIQNWMSS